jgi:hypothetical protein
LCDYQSNDTKAIDEHGKDQHGVFKCEKCDYTAEDNAIMKKHMGTHTGRNILPCGVCEFETTRRATLDDHLNAKHGLNQSLDQEQHNCNKCEKTFEGTFELAHHKCCPQQYKFPCGYSNCAFIGTSVSDIADHTYDDHRKPVHYCQHCDYEVEDRKTLMEHVKMKHKEISMINSLFAQQSLLCETFHTFKEDIGNILDTLMKGQDTLKTKMMILAEKLEEGNKFVEATTTVQDDVASPENSKNTYANKTKASDAQHNDREESDNSNTKNNDNKSVKKTKKKNVPGCVLWVGDSHSNNLDRIEFEGQTDTKVDMCIAYTVDNDRDAKYPDRNFLKAVPDKLSKQKYDTLVLQGGCNEISNLKIKSNFKAKDVTT